MTEQDPETGRRTARWLHDRARLEELRATGADLLAGELQENRRVLRELLTDDRLRLGLLLASPALDGRWTPTCATPARGPATGCARSSVPR
ncbi:hypothetical protein ACR6C2_02450 [Streptomyces sp. INA 01156]